MSLFPVHASRAFAPALLAACISAALVPSSVLAQTTPVTQAALQRYDIPAQPLASAVQQWGRVSGKQVYVNDADGGNATSTALSGEYNDEEALRELLSGTGLVPRQAAGNTIVLEKATASTAQSVGTASAPITTSALSVAGVHSSDATGEQRDIQGYDDVYDLDISTAYIGRAEVERYKGATPSDLVNGVAGVFSGDARNSGALDINIRGVQGPGRVPVTIDGTEQAITAWRGYNGIGNRNYIDPSLIGGMQIIKGPSSVRNVNTGAGGAVVVKTIDVDDFLAPDQTFGGEFKVEGSGNSAEPRLPTLLTGKNYTDVPEIANNTTPSQGDPTLRVQPDTDGNAYNVFNGEDYAYRLALGWRPSENLDVLAAYAYRERGNYYAGTHNTGYYAHAIQNLLTDDYITTMAHRLLPGNEVLNTSSELESWLFKATWRPTESQQLRFGYRDSLSHHGEIMPSANGETDDGWPQWPLSRVDAKSYNLEYTWKPEGSRWIDLYANLWRTDTDSGTYSGGTYPNYWTSRAPTILNGALIESDNDRNGVTLSNKFRFTDTLDLTVGGNYQHEKLRSQDDYYGASASWRMLPRAGRREEWQGNFSFEWRPVDFLTFNAGARYISYWAYDDFLATHEGEIVNAVSGWEARYYTRSDEEVQVYEDSQRALYQLFVDRGIFTPEQAQALVDSAVSRWTGNLHTVLWEPDADGKYSRAGNACLNGTAAAAEGLVQTSNSSLTCTMARAGNLYTGYASAKKRRDSGWMPSFSTTAHFSDHSRAYLRYDEARRFPSMFESTLSFGASLNLLVDSLKPERIRQYELGYVHDLGHLFSADTIADVKLAYWVRKTRDLIERDNSLMFFNIDKQTMRGIEFQGRYDNGRFFTDLSITKIVENEVCDESSAVMLDPSQGRIPNCVDQGFIGSYLLTQAIPHLSANWSLGGRFFDGRLELGGRIVYYEERADNDDLNYFRDITNQNLTIFNYPFSWDDTLLLDAYINWRFKENLSIELVGTNLTDQYYADPSTRTMLPAPGRTLKLSLTARF